AAIARPRGDARARAGVRRRLAGARKAGRGYVDRRHDPARGGDRVVIRIFIADDHPIVRQGLRRIVESDPGMVISGEADAAAALLAGLETKATDLVLL